MGTSINMTLRIQGLMKKLTLLEFQLWACFFSGPSLHGNQGPAVQF